MDRKFIDWEVTTDDNVTHKVEVRFTQAHQTGDSVTTFYVQHKNPYFKIEETDLEKLRIKVKDTFNAINQINWQPMLMVRMDGLSTRYRSHKDMTVVRSNEMPFTILEYNQGTDSKGQSFYSVRVDGKWGRRDDKGQYWTISPGTPYKKEEDETTGQLANLCGVCTMPDTPENRALLVGLSESISAVHLTINQLLNSNTLMSVLPGLSNALMYIKKFRTDGEGDSK